MLEPMIARAFLYRLLNEREREILRDYEARLPPRRYLQASEVCRMFRLQVNPKTEQEIQAMNKVAAEFSAILWKQRILEYKTENPEMTDLDLTDAVDGKIEAEDIGEWQEFAAVRYFAPDGAGTGSREFAR